MRKHNFRTEITTKRAKTLNLPSVTFSEDSLDDFSDNETPPKRKAVTVCKRRKTFNHMQEELNDSATVIDSKNLAVQKTKTRKVIEFIESWDDGKNNKKLLVILGPCGCGKTTLVETVIQELGCNVIRWKQSLFGGNLYKETKSWDTRSVFENTFQRSQVEDLVEDLALSLQYQPLTLEQESSSARYVVVVDDNVMSKRVRNVEQVLTHLELIAEQTVYPTIIIITCDSMASSVVAKTFERHTHSSSNIQCLSLHPVTKTEMQKATSLYCRLHNIALPEKEALTLIVEQCRGDLRWAISQLQLYWESSCDRMFDDTRDTSFDICHAIGKIFHNKRIGEQGKPKDSIFSIISSLDEPTNKVIGYLIQNCYQFYGNIGDISDLMFALCEAHNIAKWYSSMLDREMAQQCAQIIAGEATRIYNKEPVQRGFQPIHGDLYSCIPNEVNNRVELWSQKRNVVDDIRSKVYYCDIVPLLSAKKVYETRKFIFGSHHLFTL
ncbi:cell cycle checkpoint protein isoform 1 [Galdieria sulphuraria]|uniref:Cell cycle checkpoint protein isoform 1 n=1 Tax=Galdieria sulphuraria TaxID=130081 RepID=M2XSN8_GALSU|nr:cell cycle checkpoint protein isoform 1 [Galdieria sulphuraria]EME26424.1 cell cycle checkpoint protein isoform 1 [Galdieria sulphuraria]|eukprot:XP_005702944.1 cell cycle checkpoint protein isoform 1 [Galdieria sulphuraria]